MKKLTLIGGAPLAGKTTLSQKIASEDGAVELSTDSVRAWMKKLVSHRDYPELFFTYGLTAEEFYETNETAQMVVDGEVAEGRQVQKGIVSLLQTAITWDHLVIEGIALEPSFMITLQNQFSDREVESYVVADINEERIHERISRRGLWGPIDTYPNEFIPREVEWTLLYNQWFIAEAEKHQIEIRYN